MTASEPRVPRVPRVPGVPGGPPAPAAPAGQPGGSSGAPAVPAGEPGGLLLEENLVRFIHVLRHLGVPVNPAETLDALAAVQLVDLADRSQVRAALRATLVKTEQQAPLFDRAFDLFFARPEERRARVAERRLAKAAREAALARADAELRFQGRPLELSEEQLEAYARMGEEQQARLREFLAESSAGNNVGAEFQPLIEAIVRGHLDRLRRELLEPGWRPPSDPTGDEDLDTVIEGVLRGTPEDSAGRGGDWLLHLDMKDIAETDLPRATRLIRRLARRLATRLSRRYRDTRKRHRPNMRRTFRSNIRYGGVLFDLRYRERKLTRPRLLLISDVSGSMARYTAFILEFVFGLGAAVRGVEAFVFSEQLERITDRLPSAAGRFSETAQEMVALSRVWGKGTDFGTALESLLADYERLITRDTVVIIVSDTKTLGADRAATALERLRPRVREILWLNTLPREEWPGQRTVALFARTATMYECSTLAHLERVIRLGVGRHIRPA